MSTPGGDRHTHTRTHERNATDIRALQTHKDPAVNMTLENVMCDLFSSIKSSAMDLTI